MRISTGVGNWHVILVRLNQWVVEENAGEVSGIPILLNELFLRYVYVHTYVCMCVRVYSVWWLYVL